ncbi:hypothetical protein H8356DRAFT_1351693 [Neocallimastix lanati (nom. inval.)]|nr:hypothetical protein H8356DRAFT_1351693 [Neocallimastix sp. JGI-2020a]
MKEHLENKPKTYSSSVNYSNAEQKALSIIKQILTNRYMFNLIRIHIDNKNRNINIRYNENYSIVTNNVMNTLISENFTNISNFLINECYLLCYFLHGGRKADFIDLNYKK